MNSSEVIRVTVIDATSNTAVHEQLIPDVAHLDNAVTNLRMTYPDKARYAIIWVCVRVPVEA